MARILIDFYLLFNRTPEYQKHNQKNNNDTNEEGYDSNHDEVEMHVGIDEMDAAQTHIWTELELAEQQHEIQPPIMTTRPRSRRQY